MKGKILIFDEIKKSYKLIILGISISVLVMTVAVFFLNLTEYMMPAVSHYYDSALEDGINIRIDNLSVDRMDVLKNFKVKDICLITESSSQLCKSSLELEETEVNVSGEYIKCEWIMEENEGLYVIPDGLDLEEFNYSEGAIVYCPEEEMKHYEEGQVFSLQLQNGEIVSRYKIVSVVQSTDSDSVYVLLPSLSVINNMEKRGVVLSYYVQGTLLKTSKYMNLKNKLSNYGASVTCDFDKILSLISILKMVFYILGILFVIISVLVIIIMSMINTHIRERFIVLQKILGAMDGQIIFIYTAIMEMQIVIADSLGCLSGFFFSKYILNIMGKLYGMQAGFQTVRMIEIFIISIVLSNIALLPFIFVFKKIVNKKDVVYIINNKD